MKETISKQVQYCAPAIDVQWIMMENGFADSLTSGAGNLDQLENGEQW